MAHLYWTFEIVEVLNHEIQQLLLLCSNQLYFIFDLTVLYSLVFQFLHFRVDCFILIGKVLTDVKILSSGCKWFLLFLLFAIFRKRYLTFATVIRLIIIIWIRMKLVMVIITLVLNTIVLLILIAIILEFMSIFIIPFLVEPFRYRWIVPLVQTIFFKRVHMVEIFGHLNLLTFKLLLFLLFSFHSDCFIITLITVIFSLHIWVSIRMDSLNIGVHRLDRLHCVFISRSVHALLSWLIILLGRTSLLPIGLNKKRLILMSLWVEFILALVWLHYFYFNLSEIGRLLFQLFNKLLI